MTLIKNKLPGFKVLLLLVMTIALGSCHVGRYFIWNFADIHDNEKFPSRIVHTQAPVFQFKSVPWNTKPQLPGKYNTAGKFTDIEHFLKDKKTVSFLIIRNDSILYEKYFNEYSHESIIPSFSVTKSFVSALVGIALAEGYIKSVHQKVTEFITDMQDTNFRKVSIEDLLNMRSGIAFRESYGSPFALMPKFYYGLDLKKYVKKLKVKEEPGRHYVYQSCNTAILSLILEIATGRTIDRYLQEKLWQTMGMEADASWNIDSKKHQTIKSFCCLNAHTRDYARFGRLYLKNGEWNGQQIIPKKWVEQSLAITNDSRDSQGYPYHYFWRVLDSGSFFAKGILGQFIYVDRTRNLIFVRLGKKSAGINWPEFFGELAKQL